MTATIESLHLPKLWRTLKKSLTSTAPFWLDQHAGLPRPHIRPTQGMLSNRHYLRPPFSTLAATET